MNSLGVTLGSVPFPHMVFHLVLVYSNVEVIQICFSESYERSTTSEPVSSACRSTAGRSCFTIGTLPISAGISSWPTRRD
jgi:hypothetical protein